LALLRALAEGVDSCENWNPTPIQDTRFRRGQSLPHWM